MINRVILIVLDSLGIGALPDAGQYDDEGANTLEHIAEALKGKLHLPNLSNLGLFNTYNSSLRISSEIKGSYGKLACASPAKDSTVGHWELAGITLKKPLPTFPCGFPETLIKKFEKKIGTKIIGNCVASGTEIIERLGSEHLKTGYPIIYTSADSVFQIAAHEDKFGLNRLYEISTMARAMLSGDYAVGRVIARPFIGEPGSFKRTENRRDLSISPFKHTVLDTIKASAGEVIGIGKIADLYNRQGITKEIHTGNNKEGMEIILKEVSARSAASRSLVFANLVDFDMLWGHRRNTDNYAKGLMEFDGFLPSLISSLRDEDILIITADHGCDPTYIKHTDHTREYVPVLAYGKRIKKGVNLGTRASFADVGQTIADIFNLKATESGKSFKKDIIQ